jgi:hypothetical protein
VPINIIYQIHMDIGYGIRSGVPIPAGIAATSDIDKDLIHEVILAARV